MTYASTVEEISATRRRFKISVPQADVSEAFKNAVNEIQATAEVRGFRKGKVPANLIRKFYESEVRKRAIERIIDRSYGDAIKSANLQIVSRPDIEPAGDFSEAAEFVYNATVDINPPIEIQGYKELSLKASGKQVGDEDVMSTLQNLGRAFGKFEKDTSGRSAEEKDFVIVNIEAKVDGEISKELSRNDVRFELGRDPLLPEFKSNLLGAKAGERKTFQVTYPADYPEAKVAGKTADVTVDVVGLEALHMPSFDDAFAQRMGAQSIEDLKRALLESMTKAEENRKLEVLGDQIVEQLLEKNSFEVPASLVESTIDRFVAEANTRLEKKDRLDPQNPEVREGFRERATKEVQAVLALGNVARAESITVDDNEVGPELYSLAQSVGMDIRQLLKQGGQMVVEEARGRVLIHKTIKHLVGLNKVEMA